MINWEDVSVNGKMCDPFFGRSLAPENRAFTDVSFSTEDLEEQGITDVTDIEFRLEVSDYDDWSADPIYDEVQTFKP